MTENTGSNQTDVIIDPVVFTEDQGYAFKDSLRVFKSPYNTEDEIPSQTPYKSRKYPMCETDAISFGVSGFDYDLRLSSNQFKVFRHIPGQMIDPKNFNPEFLYDAQLHNGEYGDYFILPHHSYALGVSLEYIDIPDRFSDADYPGPAS